MEIGTMLALDHDGRNWLMVDEHSTVVHRNEELALDDEDAAHNWAHSILSSRPGWTPPGTLPPAGPDRRYFDYYPSADSGAADA